MKTQPPLPGKLICFFLLLLFTACKQSQTSNKPTDSLQQEFKCYSKSVKDTFAISVQLPLEYAQKPNQHYPVVLLTDANFYFPMLSAVLHQYEKGGMMPPLILVGVGYKSFALMDSLRMRDFMYPKATTADEISAPGGGQHFYKFITTELLPKIDSTYRTEKTNRTLLGHSFGGYFSLFALLQQTDEKRNDFSGFVSASPPLWYNNNYLSQLPQKLKHIINKDTLNIFLSVSQKGNPKWDVQPVKDMDKQLTDARINKVKISTEVYPYIDHMDAGLISFIRGLEKIYMKAN
jgi:uncharacterized protein